MSAQAKFLKTWKGAYFCTLCKGAKDLWACQANIRDGEVLQVREFLSQFSERIAAVPRVVPGLKDNQLFQGEEFIIAELMYNVGPLTDCESIQKD